MTSKIYARIKPEGNGYLIRLILKADDETPEENPENIFTQEAMIQEFRCHYQNQQVFTATLGNAVSKNPYLSFGLTKLTPGEKLILSLSDSQGIQDQVELEIP